MSKPYLVDYDGPILACDCRLYWKARGVNPHGVELFEYRNVVSLNGRKLLGHWTWRHSDGWTATLLIRRNANYRSVPFYGDTWEQAWARIAAEHDLSSDPLEPEVTHAWQPHTST